MQIFVNLQSIIENRTTGKRVYFCGYRDENGVYHEQVERYDSAEEAQNALEQ